MVHMRWCAYMMVCIYDGVQCIPVVELLLVGGAVTALG